MSDRTKTVFRVGDWLVESELSRLSRQDESVLLEPKSMEVLIYLCRRAGEVVSADELISAVWGGRPMGDNPVYKSVAKLRRALGDEANEPRYIVTVAKKGYRLVADVEQVKSDQAAGDVPAAKPRRISVFWPLAIGIAFGVVVAAAVFWRPYTEPLLLQSISGFRGSHSQPSFAPSGDAIAFISDADGTPHVWLLDFSDAAPRQLTNGRSSDSRPRWSPNGETIIFARRGSVWSVPAASGDAQEIIREGYNPNWSRDGTRIVFERRYEIWIADADGGQQARVAGVPRKELPLAPRWPAFSPSGDEIVYLDADFTPLANLWRIPVIGGTPKQISFEPEFSSAPAWSPDGKYIIYSSQRSGVRTLWQVNIEDGSSRALLNGSGDDDFPDISADGKQLIYSNRRERYAIVRSDIQTGEQQVLHESRQLVLGPELSPDRQTVAFFAMARDGGVQIFSLNLSGGTPTPVTSDAIATHAIPRWSGDGEHIYFYLTRDRASFSKVKASGGSSEEVVPDWDWDVANGASVSPDEAQVVYSRLTGQVPVQTLIRNLDTGTERTFYATLEYPRWTKDGSSIVGALHVDQRFPGDIAICPVVGPSCRIIAREARIAMWSSDELEAYFVRGFGVSQDLFVVSVNGNDDERQLMTMTPLPPLGPFYDITSDGDIIWVRHEQEPSEIWLTELSDH